MKTAVSMPAESAPHPGAPEPTTTFNGFSQLSEGWMLCAALPPYTLARATTEKTTRMISSAPSNPTWVRAESSIPT